MAYQPKSYRKFVATAATATLVATAFAPFASAHSFKDVEEKYNDAVDFLVSKGIQGLSEGTFGTQQNIKRIDAAVMLGKALGLDKVTDAPASGFTDVPARAVTLINAFKAKGITAGKNATTFGANDLITRDELAVWIQKAYELKAKDGSTNKFTDVADNYKAAVQALVDNGITAGTTETTFGSKNNAKRGDFALFIKRAADAAVKTVEISSVSAVGAKKLKVEFNTAVDTTKAAIEVKRGTVKPSVKEIKFSEDKKSATIEYSTAMAAGDYTVTVSGLTEKALTGTVKVEAEKLTKINFLSDVAVINGNTINTNVLAENQYGEDVTTKLGAATVTATTSKGSSATVNNKGQVTVANSAPYTVGEKVVVTIVDSQSGVVSTKTLTVSQAANVKSIELGTLTTDNKDLKEKVINIEALTTNAREYYLPITVKDQYGNVLKAADLAGVNVLSSNQSIVKLASPTIVDVPGKGTVIKFDSAGASATFGTAVITVVSAATGVTANTSIEVKDNAKVDSIAIEAPAGELKLNTPEVLPVSVVDTYGKELQLKDLTITGSGTGELTFGSGAKITANNATLSVERDYVNNKAVVKLTPTAKTVILVATTATGKTQSLSLTANDAPVVSGIKGVKGDFVTLLANDTTLSTRLDGKVEFVDQYGNAIAAPAFDGSDSVNSLDYTIKAKDSTNTVTTDVTPGTIVASTTAGTETYEVILKNSAGVVLDTAEVTVTVVDAAKLTEFGINDLNKFYTNTSAAATHAQDVNIHGLLNGKKVVVNQNMAKDFTASNGLKTLNALTGVYTPTDVDTKGQDVTSTITVLVEAGDKTVRVTKDVVYSNAAPKATSLNLELDSKAVADVVQITPVSGNNIVSNGTDGFKVFAKDQYGKVITSGYKFVVTNNTTGAAITVDENGVLAITGTPAAGKSFQLNITIDGVSKAIKVVIG